MLIPGLGTGLLPRRESLQKMALQKQNSFSGNQQGNQGPSSLSSREHHSGTPSLDCSNFSNPQLHTPIYYSPLKFIISGSLQLLLFSSVQLLSLVRHFVTPRTAACQASLSFTISQSLLKLMSIESVMPSNHLILCCLLLLPPSIFPNIRVFSSESVLCIRWPKYWSFSFSISLSSEYSGLISFRIDWLDLLAVQGLSRVFSNTTVQKHQFFGTKLSSQSNSHIHT